MKKYEYSVTMSIVEFRKYYDAVQRVRELHKSVQIDSEWGFHCEYCDQDYPCGTIKALEGGEKE